MYEAMLAAELGDDVLGDDPTVAELESESARLLGKKAAVFVPSGTMGNQIAIAVHTRPGDALICDDQAHILHYEGGSLAVISNVLATTYHAEDGIPYPEAIRDLMRDRTHHTPRTRLVENTHNRHSGAAVDAQILAKVSEVCRDHGAKYHIDGARIFNAAAATREDVQALCRSADSVTFCLSKGLGAPVGSVLCGSEKFIDEARYWRKRLGGGMRQSGLLAACGLYALRNNVDRLAEDHERAHRLKSFCTEELGLGTRECRSNIVLVETPIPASELSERLGRRCVYALPFGPNLLRFVLHKDVDERQLEFAMNQLRDVLSGT